jgi:hypothetical protein
MPNKGYRQKNEHKLKISIAHLGKNNNFWGKHHTEETKQLISVKNKGRLAGSKNPFYGKRHTEETRKRIGNANKKFTKETGEKLQHLYLKTDMQCADIAKTLGCSISCMYEWLKNMGIPRDDTRRRISIASSGRFFSEETIQKMREAKKGKTSWKKGLTKENNESIASASQKLMGHPVTIETRIKMGKRKKGKYCGSENPNWQGGKSFEPYALTFNKGLKEQIKTRDNYACQICGTNKESSQYPLVVHHVDYNKKNNNPNNLITLCLFCHSKTNFNRNKWMGVFYKQLNPDILKKVQSESIEEHIKEYRV